MRCVGDIVGDAGGAILSVNIGDMVLDKSTYEKKYIEKAISFIFKECPSLKGVVGAIEVAFYIFNQFEEEHAAVANMLRNQTTKFLYSLGTNRGESITKLLINENKRISSQLIEKIELELFRQISDFNKYTKFETLYNYSDAFELKRKTFQFLFLLSDIINDILVDLRSENIALRLDDCQAMNNEKFVVTENMSHFLERYKQDQHSFLDNIAAIRDLDRLQIVAFERQLQETELELMEEVLLIDSLNAISTFRYMGTNSFKNLAFLSFLQKLVDSEDKSKVASLYAISVDAFCRKLSLYLTDIEALDARDAQDLANTLDPIMKKKLKFRMSVGEKNRDSSRGGKSPNSASNTSRVIDFYDFARYCRQLPDDDDIVSYIEAIMDSLSYAGARIVPLPSAPASIDLPASVFFESAAQQTQLIEILNSASGFFNIFGVEHVGKTTRILYLLHNHLDLAKGAVYINMEPSAATTLCISMDMTEEVMVSSIASQLSLANVYSIEDLKLSLLELLLTLPQSSILVIDNLDITNKIALQLLEMFVLIHDKLKSFNNHSPAVILVTTEKIENVPFLVGLFKSTLQMRHLNNDVAIDFVEEIRTHISFVGADIDPTAVVVAGQALPGYMVELLKGWHLQSIRKLGTLKRSINNPSEKVFYPNTFDYAAASQKVLGQMTKYEQQLAYVFSSLVLFNDTNKSNGKNIYFDEQLLWFMSNSLFKDHQIDWKLAFLGLVDCYWLKKNCDYGYQLTNLAVNADKETFSKVNSELMNINLQHYFYKYFVKVVEIVIDINKIAQTDILYLSSFSNYMTHFLRIIDFISDHNKYDQHVTDNLHFFIAKSLAGHINLILKHCFEPKKSYNIIMSYSKLLDVNNSFYFLRAQTDLSQYFLSIGDFQQSLDIIKAALTEINKLTIDLNLVDDRIAFAKALSTLARALKLNNSLAEAQKVAGAAISQWKTIPNNAFYEEAVEVYDIAT